MKTIAALTIATMLSTGVAHADPAPVQCRDLPGAMGSNSHVCRFPDGSVTNCISGPLPIMGPPCTPVYEQLAPGFWNQP
jgi:hypothetical protein